MSKVYTLGYVVEYYGESIELPIFTSIENAIKYMEETVMKVLIPNGTFERDDSVLEEKEKARWYELREEVIAEDITGFTQGDTYYRKTGNLVRGNDYWRILERDLV